MEMVGRLNKRAFPIALRFLGLASFGCLGSCRGVRLHARCLGRAESVFGLRNYGRVVLSVVFLDGPLPYVGWWVVRRLTSRPSGCAKSRAPLDSSVGHHNLPPALWRGIDVEVADVGGSLA